MRLAIDISIWQFQIQSGQGGRNPALRTLYYRLLRLIGLSIQPLFVFDGPYRPSLKRGVRIAPSTSCVDNFLVKQLLKCFGFSFHDAPGEAEAECALLQREAIVDAVLSEDVDTLMFGCTLSLRNWNAEGIRGNKGPTHVDVHRSERTLAKSGLDSDGMILVALMRGGDYIQAGIPKCGIVIACQAARAGFGKELCKLAKGDDSSLHEWRRRLNHELRTNKSGFFSRKCQAIDIPDSFPDKKVFGYYQNPVISSVDKVRSLRNRIQWDAEVNVVQLREFVAEAFNWTYLIGAKYFIRSLAPALLARKLVSRGLLDSTDRETMNSKAIAEASLIRTVNGRRAHWATDGEPELRVAYIPADVVGLDLDAEEAGPVEPADSDENDRDATDSGGEARYSSRSPTKRPLIYNPTQIEKTWVLETFVKFGAPLLVETWEEDMRDPRKFATRKARERAPSTKTNSQKGAMDKFVKTHKPVVEKRSDNQTHLPPVSIVSNTRILPPSSQRRALQENRKGLGTAKSLPKPKRSKIKEGQFPERKAKCLPENHHNPWTVAKKESMEDLPRILSKLELHNSSSIESLSFCNKAGRSHSPLKATHGFITQRSNARKAKHVRSASASSSETKPLRISRPKEEPSTLEDSSFAGPSPRKKRSSLRPANASHTIRQLETPKPTSKRKAHPQKPKPNEKVMPGSKSPRRTNRLLDFRAASRLYSPASESNPDSLPSPSVLLSPPPSQLATKEPKASAKDKELSVRKQSNIETLVAVRESLEGAWKHIEPWEAEKLDKAWRVYSRVEVVDLTGV